MKPNTKQKVALRQDPNFDTFQPKQHDVGGQQEESDDQREKIWLRDGDINLRDSYFDYKANNVGIPLQAEPTPKEKVMLDFNYKVAQHSYETLRKTTFLDIISKINHFKLSGTSRIRTAEYMNRKSRDDKLIYPFGIERDPLVLKVLNQILYDELEKSIRACCTGPTPQSKARAEQSLVDSMSEAVQKIREEEQSKHADKIQSLKTEIDMYKQQIKRKNELINRLLTDKTLFTRYFDDFSLLFTDVYRHLHAYEDKKAADLMTRIAKANDFLRWAKDYSGDERRYIADADWSAIKEKEKQNYLDESDLDKSKVWAYKKQIHLNRISPDKSQNKYEYQGFGSDGKKQPSRSLDLTPKQDHRIGQPNVSKQLFGDTDHLSPTDPKRQQGNQLIQAKSFEDFAKSFHKLTYEELQEFCLALSDQLTQAKKEMKKKIQQEEEKLLKLKEEFQHEKQLMTTEKRELLAIMELEKKARDQLNLEHKNSKDIMIEGWTLAFDCYNLLMTVSKAPSLHPSFCRFLLDAASKITDGFMLTRSFLSKVRFDDEALRFKRSKRRLFDAHDFGMEQPCRV